MEAKKYLKCLQCVHLAQEKLNTKLEKSSKNAHEYKMHTEGRVLIGQYNSYNFGGIICEA